MPHSQSIEDAAVIAYFSMEIGVSPAIPTYSGGLGVLAGDTLRSAADLGLPLVGLTLVHHCDYFHQQISEAGDQIETSVRWPVAEHLEKLETTTSVLIEGRTVRLGVWKYTVIGCGGKTVPVFFLDADQPDNADWDRHLTDFLYGGDQHYRLCQEIILGIGGVRMLRALGYNSIQRFHLNEGHSSLLALELLDEQHRANGSEHVTLEEIDTVRKQCVFTTHTPVPAGQDQFPLDLVTSVLGTHEAFELEEIFCWQKTLNMTYLALSLSHHVNGVAKSHGKTAQQLFVNYKIDSITNGIHAATWAAPAFERLFDEHIFGWREENSSLRYALSIPRNEVWMAHLSAKQQLLTYVNRYAHKAFDNDVLTIGFARRFTSYKRPMLIFSDVERLRAIAKRAGAIQLVFAGKAHPQDGAGKELIRQIFEMQQLLAPEINVVFLPDYDMNLAKLMVSGADVWLNTPEPPLEASGTSGMKAALNGVPSLSILDGWWLEGWIEDVTGWSIGALDDRTNDANSLYEKLESKVIPIFYRDREKFLDVMRHALALNGSFFNSQRMLQQYAVKAYFD